MHKAWLLLLAIISGCAAPSLDPQLRAVSVHQVGSPLAVLIDATIHVSKGSVPGQGSISDVRVSRDGTVILGKMAWVAANLGYLRFADRPAPGDVTYRFEGTDDNGHVLATRDAAIHVAQSPADGPMISLPADGQTVSPGASVSWSPVSTAQGYAMHIVGPLSPEQATVSPETTSYGLDATWPKGAYQVTVGAFWSDPPGTYTAATVTEAQSATRSFTIQ